MTKEEKQWLEDIVLNRTSMIEFLVCVDYFTNNPSQLNTLDTLIPVELNSVELSNAFVSFCEQYQAEVLSKLGVTSTRDNISSSDLELLIQNSAKALQDYLNRIEEQSNSVII